MKLGAVYSETVNALYRVATPMIALQELGHEIVEYKQQRGKRLPIRDLAGCDLVQIHRPMLIDDEDDCIARLRAAGCVVSFDEDDDMGCLTPEIEAIVGTRSYETSQRDFARLLAHMDEADLVTTPSEALADRFEQAGARRIEVIDNYLLDRFVGTSPRGHDGLVVGWHACREHLIDAEQTGIAAVLERILAAHPDVRVLTIGIDLQIDHERYEARANVPFDTLTQHLADFDVGLAPLADLAFSRARSNVKLREYAAAGVPWLASPIGPYEPLGEAQGGRLVADGGWYEAIERLVTHGRERRKLARRASQWGQRETISSMAHLWEEAFLEAVYDQQRVA
jgi:glycosyltransferase involved in cell wall biosynthesis